MESNLQEFINNTLSFNSASDIHPFVAFMFLYLHLLTVEFDLAKKMFPDSSNLEFKSMIFQSFDYFNSVCEILMKSYSSMSVFKRLPLFHCLLFFSNSLPNFEGSGYISLHKANKRNGREFEGAVREHTGFSKH